MIEICKCKHARRFGFDMHMQQYVRFPSEMQDQSGNIPPVCLRGVNVIDAWYAWLEKGTRARVPRMWGGVQLECFREIHVRKRVQ